MKEQLKTDDTRILRQKPLVSPALLMDEVRPSEAAVHTVETARNEISKILSGDDDRLLLVTGPCSIHDISAAWEYAEHARRFAEKYSDDLLVVMRTYFEKPRTVVGWKGLINDPFIDGTFRINEGLRIARRFLCDLAEKGVPAATEFLDPVTPQFIADLVSYGAIGARTTESQIHRELASGLSMPVGFKNGTDGSIQVAIDAVRASRHSHRFPSVTKDGVVSIFETAGNEDTHVILRGGSRTGPNYGPEFVAECAEKLAKLNLPPHIVVDCSHGNSNKDYSRQTIVAENLAEQISAGSRAIAGAMVESNLVEGRQDYNCSEKSSCTYGQSITDACISVGETEKICEILAKAVRARRNKAAK
ncbi:MAG: 3-deoxy-7-phosphoheptulonate synthase [Opitutae bacterium]|nr:3-deoxy-7-phosphoheptulonate synthase [Opitutae bacterium]MCD8299425.1 3-deoxy-7-phosphoheptulonate synthase [Opitutae bacterium]